MGLPPIATATELDLPTVYRIVNRDSWRHI